MYGCFWTLTDSLAAGCRTQRGREESVRSSEKTPGGGGGRRERVTCALLSKSLSLSTCVWVRCCSTGGWHVVLPR